MLASAERGTSCAFGRALLLVVRLVSDGSLTQTCGAVLSCRQRKEWTRKLDVEGKLYWFRRSACVGAATKAGASRSAVHSPGVIARFKTPPEVLQEQLDADTTTQTKVERVQRLTAEVAAMTLKFLTSGRANPVVSTLSVAMSARVPVEALLASSTKDFPTKYAMFVASTSQMLQVSGKKTLRLYLYRDDLFCQSMELLSEIPAHYIGALLRLSFVGESGIDAGALHREWVVLVSEALANRASGVFTCTNEGEQALSLNANSAIDIGDDHLMYFHAAGRFIGRALLEGTALGFHLSTPLLKLILGLPLSFSDVEHYDPETYRSMQWLLDHDGVDALGLDFSLAVPRRDGSMVVVDLVPGGRDIAVTDANKHAFIERKWQYLLVESASSQLYVFLKGLYEVLPHEHLMLFDPEELDFVLCGSNDIDVDDWEQSTKHADSIIGRPVRTWFWEIVREMPNEYRRRLLQFATGSDRVPLSGFSALTSHDGKLCPFTLNGVPLGSGEYIWSHACFNQLDVPLYQSRAKLKAVLYAVLDTELHGFTTV